MGSMKVEISIKHERASASGSRAVAGVSGGGRQGLSEGMMEGGLSPKEAKKAAIQDIKRRLKNSKTEEGILSKVLKGLAGKGGGIGKIAGGAVAGLGGAAAATGVGAVVAVGLLIFKKMIENSEAVKAIRTIIDMTLGSILDTLFGSLFVLSNIFMMGGKLTEQVMALPGQLWSMWGAASDKIIGGLDKLMSTFKDIYWDKPIEQWNERIAILRDMVTYMEGKGKLLGGYIDKFGAWLTAMPVNLQTSITKMIDSGMSWLRDFGKIFGAYVSEGVMGTMNVILPGLGDTFGSVITGIGSGFSGLITNLTSPFTTLQTTLGGLDFSPFSKFLKLDFSKVMEFFNLGDAFASATKFVKSLSEAVTTVTGGGGSGNDNFSLSDPTTWLP